MSIKIYESYYSKLKKEREEINFLLNHKKKLLINL